MNLEINQTVYFCLHALTLLADRVSLILAEHTSAHWQIHFTTTLKLKRFVYGLTNEQELTKTFHKNVNNAVINAASTIQIHQRDVIIFWVPVT